MAKANSLQPSFSAGEFSPRVQGRSDSERYKNGLDDITNYIPTTQGPLIPRPGTKYVGNDAKDPSKPPALIPFQFSQTQNYMIEAGDRYMRFYTNNGRVLTSNTSFIVYGYGYQDKIAVPTVVGIQLWPFTATRPNLFPDQGEEILTGSSFIAGGNTGSSAFVAAGSILELPTIYTGSSYLELKYAQKQDALYLFHKDYPTHKLQRKGGAYWDLKKVRFKDGPYLPQNTYAFTGDMARVGLSSTSVTGSSAIGVQTYPHVRITNITAGTSNLIIIHTGSTASPFINGDKVYITGVVGVNNANNSAFGYWPIKTIDNSRFFLLGSDFSGSYTGSGIIYPALFTGSSTTATLSSPPFTLNAISLFNGPSVNWGHIVPTGTASATLYLDSSTPVWSGSSPFWRLGAWNEMNGFPSCGALHQQRLSTGGLPNIPQRIDMSVSADIENFSPFNSSFVVADNNAISINLDHEQLNKIQWMKSDDKGLLVGTLYSEWQITPNNLAAALSPTNVNAKETSTFGSFDTDAVKASNATLYIQRAQRSIRELNYFFQVDTYRSTDITELSDHITHPAIFKIVSQKETVPVVWALRSDGVLTSMSYSRDDVSLQVGWAKHQMGGQRDSAGSQPQIKSIAVIPDPTGSFDQLWMTTRRYINGTSVLSIEYMAQTLEHDTLQEDFFNVDMGATYDVPISIQNITSGSGFVTSASHGLANDDQILITKVVGLNSSIVDAMGVRHSSSLVNYQHFIVNSSTTNNFHLKDLSGNFVDTRSYSAYFSGGEIRKMISSISGLTWLKNETVAVLADGKIHPNTIVNSGGILTLEYKAAKVQVGLPYDMDFRTLRADVGSQLGTSIGCKRRTGMIAMLLNKVFGIKIGPSFDRLSPVEVTENPVADTASPLFSGIIRRPLQGEHDFDGQVCVRQSSPTAGMVQTITSFIEENDV